MSMIDTDQAAEEVGRLAQQRWLANLHALYEFYRNHPDLIDTDDGAVVTHWLIGNSEKVRAMASVTPLEMIRSEDFLSYVVLQGPTHGPHKTMVYAAREWAS